MTANSCDKLHQYPPNKKESNITFHPAQFLWPSRYRLLSKST